MFALVVRFEVRPGHLDAFDELVASTVAQIAAREPGTIVYVSHHSADRPMERVFYECYTDIAAFEVHEAERHTRHFLAERGQHLSGPPTVCRLTTNAAVLAGAAL